MGVAKEKVDGTGCGQTDSQKSDVQSNCSANRKKKEIAILICFCQPTWASNFILNFYNAMDVPSKNME